MALFDKQAIKRHLLLFLRVFVVAGAIYLVLRGESLRDLGGVLLALNPWLFAGVVAIFVGAQVLFVLRWRLLLRVLSIHIGLWTGLKLHFLGLFYNNALPSSVGGDLLRAWYITKHVEDSKKMSAALSVFVDRIVGLTGMLIMAVFFYCIVPVEGGLAQAGGQTKAEAGSGVFHRLFEYKGVFIGVVVAVICVFGVISATSRGRTLLVTLWRRLWGLGIRVLHKSLAAAKLYYRSPFTVICALCLTFVMQGVCITGFWLLGRDLGMETNFKYYFVFFPVSWLLGALPISVGGLGVMEGSLKIMFLRVSGATSLQAAAIAICQRLVWLVSSLGGLGVHIFGAHLPAKELKKQEILIDCEENVP